ncbi:Alpha/beta hydrolase family protein [Rubripirellula obstinata]|uniref:Alpha/beta hydrolase family protein n=1 Tax=Rubripirellula obstinata TaxID=406547 RepID=A0A5B1CEG0_9BACT|nr:alpha/beta hydrolase [Rubripirellula obstinata]KAA1257853.1 Alpha/beta hydrolase family protein [Rubripirellula obstinata]
MADPSSEVGSNVVLDSIAKNPGKAAVKKGKRKRYRKPRSWPARILISVLRLVFFGYIAVVVAMVFMEERLVYPGAYRDDPSGMISSQPDDLIQTIPVNSTGDVVLPARLLDRPGAQNVVLFFHGNGAKAKWLDQRLQQLSDDLSASVMAAEYRGYEDDVKPTEKGVIEDCLAARDYLCDRYQIKPSDIILYGSSLGGGCAVAVASRGGAKALVLERTFDRAYAVAANRYWFLPVRFLMRNRYDSLAKLTVYDGPLLQIHGDADSSIPIEHAERLFASARCVPKEFITVPGMGHNDRLPQAVQKQIADWVRSLPSQKSAKSL